MKAVPEMKDAPKGLRLQIAFFGRRNAGKSSVVNAVAGQNVSIVSDVPGTTTDPVEKAMELLPMGPVLLIDTAGLDDTGKLGEMRVGKSRKIEERTDIAVIVSGDGAWTDFENQLAEIFAKREVPVIAVFNKSDLGKPQPSLLAELEVRHIPVLNLSAKTGEGIEDLRQKLISLAPDDYLNSTGMLGGLAAPGKIIVLVTPIDLEAPKGRLILPQVHAVRDVLDNDTWCCVVKENSLSECLKSLNAKPALVVTDSQAFANVDRLTPPDIELTSFSILMARMKGDLSVCAAGAAAIDRLRDGDKVLIAEACTHHPIGEDIGTVKIPKLLAKKTGAKLQIDHCMGHDFPANLAEYSLVIHCGACTFNRRELLTRIEFCRGRKVPFTNYGIAIAHCIGILRRALRPFPGAFEAYTKAAVK